MRDKGPPTDDNVVELKSFRNRAILQAGAGPRKERRLHSSIHIEVDDDGDLQCQPIEIQQVHALALLSACIELSSYLIDLYGRGLQ
jgi:hypothetical protein